MWCVQVNLVLESAHPAEVKEQALCIIGNIASGAGATDYVMNDDRILHKLLHFMVSMHSICDKAIANHGSCFVSMQTASDTKLQEGAMFAIKNLIEKNDNNTPERLSKLNDLGVVDKLEAYLNMSTSHDTRRPSEEYDALRYITFH